MKKQQLFVVGGGIILFSVIYFLGNTIPPKRPAAPEAMATHPHKTLTTEDVLSVAKSKLPPDQQQTLAQLENSVVRGDIQAQQIKTYNQLSDQWLNDYHRSDIGAYYAGLAGDLEKSEKKLTFAAHLLLNNVMLGDSEPEMQTWMAENAKQFFDKALVINPSNDSSRIGRGACYMFGNISDNPMQGILPVREIAEKNPENIYAQMILGMGGIKSGQYDNAVKRFTHILQLQPDNLEAALNLAETYDRMGDKPNAVKWYKTVKDKIAIPEAKKEIEERINNMQQ